MAEHRGPNGADGAGTGRRRALRAVLTVGSLFIGVHLLLPLIGGLEATAETIARAQWWLSSWVLGLEATSFWAYGELELTLLRAGGQLPARGLVQRAVIAGTALGKTLPGGNATAMVMMISALRRRGLDSTRTAAGMAAAGAISWATLALMLPVASVLALAGGEGGAVALGSVGLALAVLATVGLAPMVIGRPERAGRVVRRVAAFVARGPLGRFIDPTRIGAIVARGFASASALARDRQVLLASGRWAAANWLLDLAVLGTVAVVIGERTPLLSIPLGYVVGQLVTLVPITPGGVGIIEPTMIGILAGAGAPAAEATAIVLAWRLVSHWLPIIAGLLVLPTLGGSGRLRGG